MPTWPAWRRAKRPANCRKCSAGWRNSSEPKCACGPRCARCWPIRCCLSGVSSLVVIGLVTFVLPKFVDIFGQFEVALPMITQVDRGHVRRAAEALVDLGAAHALRRSSDSSCRETWKRAGGNGTTPCSTLPILRDITRAFYIGRTFRLLGLMIESGVPLLEGLRLTRNSVRNMLYRKLFDDLEESILNGRGLATSLINAGFVPAVAAEMVLTAERTGTLGMVTELMGEHYEEEGESKLRELATLLEPLIIVAMGVIVATIVMAVMLPMFDIATMAK